MLYTSLIRAQPGTCVVIEQLPNLIEYITFKFITSCQIIFSRDLGRIYSKAKRRRIAQSICLALLSAMFIVTMIHRLCGRQMPLLFPIVYMLSTERFLYSNAQSNSPNTIGRLARLISSIIKIYGLAISPCAWCSLKYQILFSLKNIY